MPVVHASGHSLSEQILDIAPICDLVSGEQRYSYPDEPARTIGAKIKGDSGLQAPVHAAIQRPLQQTTAQTL